MNNDEFMNRIPSNGTSPRIMVLGEVLPVTEYDSLSNISVEDIENIREDWLNTAPPAFRNLLDAEVE
jgi:hypothetical protein